MEILKSVIPHFCMMGLLFRVLLLTCLHVSLKTTLFHFENKEQRPREAKSSRYHGLASEISSHDRMKD